MTESIKLINKSVAIQAYIYGYPVVVMEKLRTNDLNYKAPINKFYYTTEISSPEKAPYVTPNADCLYATAWLDLKAMPIILSIPANTDNRYFIVQMLDIYTNTFNNVPVDPVSNPTDMTYIIVGPASQFTPNSNVIIAPTPTIFLVARVEVRGNADLSKAIAFEKQIRLRELRPVAPSLAPAPLPQDIFNRAEFFDVMFEAIQHNPPPAADLAYVDRFRSLSQQLSNPTIKQALVSIIPEAQTLISNGYVGSTKYYNGWTDLLVIGTYDTNYLVRAYVAQNGLGANIKPFEFYLLTETDADGLTLNGKNNYLIHFENNQLPKTNAFWSINLYVKGKLVHNSIERYGIGSNQHGLQYGPTGSLDIYVQNAMPSQKNINNWLPSPLQDFNLVMRIYAATVEQIADPSNMPRVTKLNSQIEHYVNQMNNPKKKFYFWY